MYEQKYEGQVDGGDCLLRSVLPWYAVLESGKLQAQGTASLGRSPETSTERQQGAC